MKPPRQIKTYSVAIERDAEGFPLCRWCKVSIRFGKRPKSRTFCKDKNCLHEWKLRSDPSYAAEHVLKRDKGVCAACGLDCVALMKELVILAQFSAFGKFPDRCEELGLPKHFRKLKRRLWEMDHVVPVAEGGGSCGLDNLRTLCWRTMLK